MTKHPCRGVCNGGATDDGVCTGCYLSQPDRLEWLGCSDWRKIQILDECEERKKMTELKTLEEYEELIREWAEDKGIYRDSTWQKQVEKWGSERAELLCAENSYEMMDAFGDQYVCLVNARNMYKGGTGTVLNVGPTTCLDIAIQMRKFDDALRLLRWDMKDAKYDHLECIDTAVTTILNRNGTMVDGLFVKDPGSK